MAPTHELTALGLAVDTHADREQPMWQPGCAPWFVPKGSHMCARMHVWFSLSVVAAIAQLMSLGSACLTVLASHVANKVWPWLMPKGNHTCACVSECLSWMLLATNVAVAAVARL